MSHKLEKLAVLAALASAPAFILVGCSDFTAPADAVTATPAVFAAAGIPGKPICLPWQTCPDSSVADSSVAEEPLEDGADSLETVLVAAVAVEPGTASLLAGTTAQFEAKLYDAFGNEITGPEVLWTSSDTVVVAVSSTGLASARVAGSALVIATSDGVRGAAAVTVTELVNGTPVYPGESIQSAVDANPPGTTFILKTGIHRQQTIIPQDRQRFIGEPGAILDGEGVTQWAVDLRTSPRKNVTLKGLVIRGYTPVNSGGMRGMVNAFNGTDWIIEDNEIHGSTVSGLEVGPGAIVRRNKIHSNRYSGIGGRPDGGLIENNDVYLNGGAAKEDASVEGRSGMKFARTKDLTIKGNRVYRNYADGIWCDIDCRFVLIENNHVYENSGRGIYYEISYDGLIRGNLVERNCLSCGPGIGNAPNWYTGIAVSTSTRVEIYGNTLIDNANGIQARMDSRGSGTYGTYELADLYVYGNGVRQRSGVAAGLYQSVGDDSYFTSRNNRFDHNSYELFSLYSDHFHWKNAARTWSGWRSNGQDSNGSAGVI